MHPNADVSIQDPKGMEGLYPCPECRRETSHEVLSIVNSYWSDENTRFWDHFLTVRCKGCGTISFCHVKKCDLEEIYDEQGIPFLPQHITHYPQFVDADSKIVVTYVDKLRIQELENITGKKFDTAKLVQMLLELNRAYAAHSFLSCVFLIRSILDHVPPIFSLDSFKEVANNYAGGGKSFRQHMQHLENSSRKLADFYLHMPVRVNESLPNSTQVEYRADIDALLAEVVRILKAMH